MEPGSNETGADSATETPVENSPRENIGPGGGGASAGTGAGAGAGGGGELSGEGYQSAIERQRAAVEAARAAMQRSHRKTSDPGYRPDMYRPDTDDDEDRWHFPGWALGALLLLLLVLAAGAAMLVPDIGRPLQETYRAAVQGAHRLITSYQPIPDTASKTAPHPTPKVEIAPTPERVPPPETITRPVSAPAQAASAAEAESPAPAAVSIPIDGISLRERPGLLEQLVEVYRSQVAKDPGNSTARDAFLRLREKTLTEFEVIVNEANAQQAVTSRAVVLRLFPELAENPRYQALNARVDQMPGTMEKEKTDIAAEPTSVIAPTPEPPVQPQATAPATPANIANAPAARAKAAVEKPEEKSLPSKPDIQVAAVTPGRMEAGRFVPAEGGKVFLLVLNYRNITQHRDKASDSELEVLLGNVRDRQVLAEVSTTLSGDRGTTSVPIETVVPGYAGESYKLNFILNGKLLSSRTIRLSPP